MFDERTLHPEVEAVRDAHAPDALVLDATKDFEALPEPALDELALRTDALDPADYDPDWVPDEGPAFLDRLATRELTIGAPGDGSVAWTTQTTPPVILVKPRVQGSPEGFVAFLVAEALVEAGAGLPEHFLGFFREQYPDFADAVPGDATDTYQLAAACLDAYRGLHTRDVFESWAAESDYPVLAEAWRDAGERVQPRLDGLAREVARGSTGFSDAAELACSGVKHGLDVPTPFGALDSIAYRNHGAAYAVRWAAKLFEND
ncbi:DUF7089 family protein [Halocalculus aciditolerans]|uniref:Uncharacterized protein n=1 Tax=Halocalculus aciditolerans TaxID=1383812 RepID=A0A830EZ05_9EURY|nr:hypothetical protein [Halocalculus aciditolerans]GGL46167.1 hypothetical protein GCM10009039_00690 [Halocalculus aciditolerans]